MLNFDLDPFTPYWHDAFQFGAFNNKSNDDPSVLTGSTEAETPSTPESSNNNQDDASSIESSVSENLDASDDNSLLSKAEIESETSENQQQDAVLEDLNTRYFENDQISEENYMEAILKDLKARAWFDDEAD